MTIGGVITEPGVWNPVASLPRGKRVEALLYGGKVIIGRTTPRDGKVRDCNTVTDSDGYRHAVEGWRYPPAE